MTAHTRANAFQWYNSDLYAVWFDYDNQHRIVSMTVENDTVNQNVIATAVTVQSFQGQNTFTHTFGPGTSSIAIPIQSGVTVGFDATDGNAPFLTGIVSITFSTV